MPSYESTMIAKDVKSLVVRHGLPLDLHPVALTEGWTIDKLLDDMIGLYEQHFKFSGIRVPFSALLLAVIKHFRVHISQLVPLGLKRLTMFELYYRSLDIVPSVNLFRVFYKVSKQGHWFSFEKRVGKDRRAIPYAMAWRHHDSDVNDPAPKDGFSALDVQALTKRVIDLRPVPSGLLFQGGLATTWDFPSFCPVFKDTEGNVITMSEYLRFPFLFGATIKKGTALTSQDQRVQHNAPPFPVGQVIPDKNGHQKEVEVEDPKIVAIRERKARVAAKKREKKKRGADEGEGSRPKVKRKKASAVRKDGFTASEYVSSPEPLRAVDPTGPTTENPPEAVVETAESR
ncbi:hypothetical protein Tco_1528311 [Tanacetum coccineum]